MGKATIVFILILSSVLFINGCATTLKEDKPNGPSQGLFACQKNADCIPLRDYLEGEGKTELSTEARLLVTTLHDMCINKKKTSIIQDINYLKQVLGCSTQKDANGQLFGNKCNLDLGYVPKASEGFQMCRCELNICETQTCTKYGCGWTNIENQLPARQDL